MADRRQRFENEKHEYQDPSLLLGCWFDERARREADFQEQVNLFSRGQLPAQKCRQYMDALNRTVPWSESLDGFLRNGSVVGVSWQYTPIFLSGLPYCISRNGHYEQPCLATGATPLNTNTLPARSALRLYRSDSRIPDSASLMNGECLLFNLDESFPKMFLSWESPNPMPISNPRFVENSGSHALWKTVGSGIYITVNAIVEVVHVASGYRLTLEQKKPIRTLLGTEYEVTCRFNRNITDMWRFMAPCRQPIRSPEAPPLHRSVWKIWK